MTGWTGSPYATEMDLLLITFMVLSRLICSEKKPLTETIFQTLQGEDYFSSVTNKNQSGI